MIIFLFVKLYAWGYGVELSEHARLAYMVFSLFESICVCAFGIVGYFVGQYDAHKKEVAK